MIRKLLCTIMAVIMLVGIFTLSVTAQEHADNFTGMPPTVTIQGTIPSESGMKTWTARNVAANFPNNPPADVDTVGEKVDWIAEKCREAGVTDTWEIALWLHDWLIYNANYDYTFTYYHPEGVLLNGTGVCQSYAEAYALLLNEFSIENVFLGSGEMNHAWNLVKIDGEWCHIDCTWDDPNEGGGYENHNYFGMTDKMISADHIWDTSYYVPCTSKINYYPIRMGYLVYENEEEMMDILDAEAACMNESFELYYIGGNPNFPHLDLFSEWFSNNAQKYGLRSYGYSYYPDSPLWLGVRLTYQGGHTHYYQTITIDPTCIDDGYTTYSCSCGDIFTADYVDALGHNWGDWVTESAGNCTVDTIMRRDCTRCGDFERETDTAPGHDYVAEVTAPTCTEKGYTTHTCAVCGDTYTDSEVDALNHEMGDWETIKKANCTEDGSKRRDCNRCDHYEEKTIFSIGHDYVPVVTAPTCTEKGYTTHTCSVCGDYYLNTYVDALDHAWDNGVIIKEPTEDEKGIKTCTCKRCGTQKDFPVPVLGHVHKYTAVTTAPTCSAAGYTTHTCTCGDYYVDTPISALGHNWGGWLVETIGNCAVDAVNRRDCLRCGDFEREIIAAPGHDYEAVVTAPTYTEQGYTTHTCSACGDSYVDTYVDPLPAVEIQGARMILGNELKMQFAVKQSDIIDGVEYAAVITKTYADGRDAKTVIVPQNEWTTFNSYYLASFDGIAAKEMGDKIYIQIIAADGTEIGEIWEDSVAMYALRMLRKTDIPVTRAIYVEMLNYGAAAQVYFKYNVENLVNAELTPEEKAYGLSAVKLENNRVADENYEGSQLNLASSIQLRMQFKNINSSMYAIATFTNHLGKKVETRIDGSEFIHEGRMVVVNAIVAADYKQDVTVTVYNAEGEAVATAVDSMASYIARMSSGNAIYDAVLKYCAAAHSYLHRND